MRLDSVGCGWIVLEKLDAVGKVGSVVENGSFSVVF
jgi:hypothetical protein